LRAGDALRNVARHNGPDVGQRRTIKRQAVAPTEPLHAGWRGTFRDLLTPSALAVFLTWVVFPERFVTGPIHKKYSANKSIR